MSGINGSSSRMLQISDEVPDFTAPTQLGLLSFHNYVSGGWCLFFAHPADFTPVCTTEFGTVAKLAEEFAARNCKILGLSVDSVEQHEIWIRDINETQETEVTFPIIADEHGDIALKLGFGKVDPRTNRTRIDYRGLYLIDPSMRVQLSMVYPQNVGRNFYEILRTLDALQLGSYFRVGTPANWKAGEDVFILPEVDDDLAKDLFPKGFTSIKPYLRLTPMPELNSVDNGSDPIYNSNSDETKI